MPSVSARAAVAAPAPDLPALEALLDAGLADLAAGRIRRGDPAWRALLGRIADLLDTARSGDPTSRA